MTIISTSILSADFLHLSEQVKQVEAAGTNWLHLDIMDGVFVPNITFGPGFVKAIRSVTSLVLDAHLMIDKPERYIEDFIKAGADIITIHPEATNHTDRVLNFIKSFDKKAGVAINPATDINFLKYLLNVVDHILVMSVNPGFAGQKFIESQLEKVKVISSLINTSTRNITLGVDGGLNKETARAARNAGANVLVAGNYIFNSNLTYPKAISDIRG